MEATLDRIQNITKTGVGLNSVSNQVKKIAEAAQKLSEGGIKKMSNLATALDRFSRLGDVKISANVGRQIGSIADAAIKLQAADLSKITILADSLRPFSTMGNAHLTSYVNQLGKMPQVIRELNAADLDKFIANIKELNTALAPFAANMEKISNGFSAFPSRIQRLVTSTEKYNSTMSKANKITAAGKSNGLWGFLNSAHSKYLALTGVFGMVSNTLGSFVDKSASYSENLNLFTVAMGKYAEEAADYAESVQAALGIDMSEWMRNQGIFMQIATGFGVIEEKAYTMSQGLTQIAYDIASFYNISTEEAMQKVQSGISGELEPLRRLGYALDAATLQQVAYDNGIRQNINTMTQAQKSQLRYVAIMEQSTNVMGDMSRTILSPANALRVMNMQLEQLQRALGNAILPLLMKILPYVQAVVVVLTDAINKLAVMFGFELPEIDYSGLEGLKSGAEDAEDSLNGAAQAAKELKNATLGLDELNVISPNSGTGTGVSGGYDLPIDIESYKFFNENYINQVSEIANKLEPVFEAIAIGITAIGTALMTYKIVEGISGFGAALAALSLNPTAIGIAAIGAAVGVLAVALSQEAIPQVEIFDESISELTQRKVEPFIEDVRELWDSLAELEFTNAIIAEEDVATIGELAAKMRQTIIDELSIDKASFADTLAPIREALGEQLYSELIEANANYYADIEQRVTDGEARINAILGTAAEENRALTENEWAEVNRIRDELMNIGVQHLSGTQLEYLTIMENIKTSSERISAEQALSIIEDAKRTRDETISAANQQYIGIVDEVQRMYDAGKISKEQYDAIIMAAEESRDSTIASAHEQYDTILDLTQEKMGELSKHIDWETGKIKSYWQITWEESTKQLKDFWDNMVNNTIQAWEDLNNGINRVGEMIGEGLVWIVNGIIIDIENMINAGIDGINFLISSLNAISFDLPDWLGGGHFGLQIDEVAKISIPRFASGGYPDEGSLFIARERGAEMVGSIGGRTAVANNDQIVEAIQRGVYEAEMAARSQGGGDTYVYIDSDEVSSRIEKRKRESGMSIFAGGVVR